MKEKCTLKEKCICFGERKGFFSLTTDEDLFVPVDAFIMNLSTYAGFAELREYKCVNSQYPVFYIKEEATIGTRTNINDFFVLPTIPEYMKYQKGELNRTNMIDYLHTKPCIIWDSGSQSYYFSKKLRFEREY